VTRGRPARPAAGGAKAAVGERFFGYTLRTPRWRYTEWDEGRQGRELYDHQADPQELTNLADRPEHAPMIAELSAQLGAAVKSSFPPDGQTPQLPAESVIWAPQLVD
jgi:iduronate 2-sulfatase